MRNYRFFPFMSIENLLFNLNRFKTDRLKVFVGLSLITLLGFASKFYTGPGAWWFNNYVGGLLYEIFWCLIGAFFFPEGKPFWIAFWVFAMTCFLEFLQLWHPPLLEALRRTFIGRTLIGTTFSGWDFLYYAIGCGIGWYWLKQWIGENKGKCSAPS